MKGTRMGRKIGVITFVLSTFTRSCLSYWGILPESKRLYAASGDVKCTRPSIWSEKVNYVDPNNNLDGSARDMRELPLFLLSGVFYPQGSTVLNIFEMKYRCGLRKFL